MKTDPLAKILKENPKIDPTAIERSRQAAKQLADVGVKLGGYKLEPALGDKIVRNSEQSVRGSGQRGSRLSLLERVPAPGASASTALVVS